MGAEAWQRSRQHQRESDQALTNDSGNRVFPLSTCGRNRTDDG